MKILLEATGSLTSGYLIKAVKQTNFIVVGSDINEFNHGKYLCDEFITMPKADDENLWMKIENILIEKNINVVIPSLDETLLGWAERKDYFKSLGIEVVISPKDTIETFQDKWKTHLFFSQNNINTPKTSLKPVFELLKPRFGRGGKGIVKNDYKNVDMTGNISQEKVSGNEYTVDILFSKDGEPIYIVPRLRIDVKDGKSTKGIVIRNQKIDNLIEDISKKIKFIGPVNFQLFETPEGELVMIEVNPRIAGGMALGFAATENWIRIIIENIVLNNKIDQNKLKSIRYGLKMVRYYEEFFISPDKME